MVKENRKSLLYGSGITWVFAEDRATKPETEAVASLPAATITEGTNKREGANIKVEWRCQHCQLWGHRYTSSNACLENKKRLFVGRIVDETKAAIGEGAYALGVMI
jgi:hypothetical protein